jgi:hypothetical protein
VFWGDTHLHTQLSTDANAQGNKNINPADAYTLARGGTIHAHNGMEVKLHRPLDFLVIADHAENLGVANAVQRRDPALRKTDVGTRLADAFEQLMADGSPTPEALREFVYSLGTDDINDDGFRQTIWNRVTRTADQYNEPGQFSALIGYEWTSRFENGTRHRVVIFKDGAGKTNQVLPFSARDSANPEDLWRFLARYEALTGGEVISIAHNPNLSNGREFAVTDLSGKPFSLAHQKLRERWEPLLEVTQIKGDSETLAILSPTDEFADYETWEGWSVIRGQGIGRTEAATMDAERTQYEYARSGLKLGLQQYAEFGVIQIRHDRQYRCTHRTTRSWREQFLGQARDRRAQRRTSDTLSLPMAPQRFRIRGRVGKGKHTRGSIRGDEAEGNVRDNGLTHDRAFLRRLEFRA